MQNIQVRVTPNGSSLKFYKIQYREDLGFWSFLLRWRTIVSVWDGAELSYDQPVLFERFQDAEAWAKELKAKPRLIKRHYQKQDKIFEEARERRARNFQDRNITKIF